MNILQMTSSSILMKIRLLLKKMEEQLVVLLITTLQQTEQATSLKFLGQIHRSCMCLTALHTIIKSGNVPDLPTQLQSVSSHLFLCKEMERLTTDYIFMKPRLFKRFISVSPPYRREDLLTLRQILF